MNITLSENIKIEASVPHASVEAYSFKYAQDYGLPSDPNRLEAGNREGWNYGRGNPPNQIKGVVDMSLRPQEVPNIAGTIFLFFMFKGVSSIYYLNRVWKNTGQKINENWFRYKVSIEDPL